ncbi:Eco57I restriction-modification methylase domain-containing protein [Lutibacter sp. A64]|uniref:Eco57I restriction-modification methylase domain-containing protein n=1 Tax=Lutibacter sp. A64 TaxID=2918526 RepID=UPI001F0696DD|nr:Eco57I restriction-modification methylase domain-containing protein [Lutibacter sp. A64]UMB54630.1 Eco57I restriction-modification methylase domain-containing protein [Lutibacter sp. A64]
MANNNQLDIQLLENLIIGRVEPHIYAFTTETVPNYLKVGDTYRPIEQRLNEWRKHFPELEKKYQKVAKVDEETFFRDFAVHKFLESEIHKTRLLPDSLESIPYYSNEFFKDTEVEELDDAIADIQETYQNNDTKYQFYKFEDSHIPIVHTYKRTESYDPRPNQDETIKRFKEAIKKGRTNLLMYAVMRFGKSFTSMCCAVAMDAKIVLIVSAKADVREEWKKTVESHIKFDGFSFLDSNSLLESGTIIKDKLKANEKIALFLTLQDLQGDDIKSKHKEVFENQIDLLLIDETHFGARALEYGKVLKELKSKKELKSETKLNDETLDNLDETTKTINSKIRIHLSGTPYRILMNSEFTTDDIIAFYQFTNIADDQQNWDNEYLTKDDTKEWENPYYGFPQMIRFAFNPNESSRQKMEELKKLGITYAFSELFRPKSILKDTKTELHKKFVHEQEIVDLLNVIDGTKNDDNLLSFLDYDKLKEGKMCRHIVCVLPYRASCDAFESLIKSNEFKNLSSYEVINISGVENEKIFKDTQSVKSKIEKCESENKKTITLTVNRMLTGSTVPQWDTMLYLKDTASPQEYDQAIFRLQSQFIKTYKEPNGDSVKYNMKPQTLLVDFNPNRMFQMQEHKSQIYNVNVESNGNSRLGERIEKELQVSPIIVINNKKMVQVEPTDILNAVRQYSSERSVLDEATSISIDYSLLSIEEIKAVIDRQGKIGSRQGIEIKPSEGEGEDLDTGDKPDGDDTPGKEDKETETSKEDKVDYKGKFAMYYARILFFSFLTNSKVKSLEEIIEAINDVQDNLRIASNLSLETVILSLFQQHINPFVLSELDYKIQNINSLANDTTISPIERASNAMKKFSRLSDSEIVTPEIVTDKIIQTLPEDTISDSTLILDIASKQGEFVYSFYKKFGKKVANNFYSIPTSKIAYEFTRKVYSLLELNIENIESNYTSYDLIEENDLIEDETIKINNNDMKFNAIVGNPPYQQTISDNSKNKSLSRQIFPDFIKICVGLNPHYLSLVTPSRWFTGDAQDKSFLRLREFFQENNHIQSIVNIPISSSVFPAVEISGGINYFVYNPNHNGNIEFTEYYDEENSQTFTRPLFEEGLDIILSSGFSHNIISKVKNEGFESITALTKGRNAFGILGKNANEISSSTYQNGYYELRCKHEEIRYVDSELITKNKEIADKWKIFISKSNGAAGLLTDNKEVSILGKPYLAKPKSACTDSLIPIGNFETEFEAKALESYIKTKFLRYMVGILKTSQNILQNVYQFVPIQDFTPESDIDWTKSIEEIDKQLYEKYKLNYEEAKFIEEIIKPM